MVYRACAPGSLPPPVASLADPLPKAAARYTDAMQAEPAEPLAIPRSVAGLVERLRAERREAFLVGGCVRALHAGTPVHDFDVATDAAPEEVLALFPRAVPIGIRHGTVMVPTPDGPIDVTRYRGEGGLEGDLRRRDFTVNAVALDPRDGRIVDPCGGLADLAAGRLRAVGSAAERLAEDPVRALRAARFTSTLPLDPDAALEEAMAEQAGPLARVAGERIRDELARLLLGPRADAGLALLRRTGLEARLAPGVGEDAAAVVAALPRELELRLAGWLRGTRAAAILARLRFGRTRTRAVEQILALHPLEERVRPGSGVAARRLLARAGAERVAAAVRLREAELGAGGLPPAERDEARARLREVETAVARALADGGVALGRRQLAVDGRLLMEWLGCGPGPEVGAALRHLTERVIEDPALNTPERLRTELERWRQAPRGEDREARPRGARGPE